MSNWSGFWSYVRSDDELEQGRIVELSRSLADRVNLLTGSKIDIFVDQIDIHWGDKWASLLEEKLLQTVFLIPVVTPSYFLSDWCRKELITFSSSAKSLNLQELILPIYYVKTKQIEQYQEGLDDAVDLIHQHQWKDFTAAALEDKTSSLYRKAVDELAHELIERAEIADSKPPNLLNQYSPKPVIRQNSGEPDDGSDETTEGLDSDDGPVDTLAKGEEAISAILAGSTSITEVLSKMGELATQATFEAEEADAKGKGFVGRLSILRKYAQDLSVCSDELAQYTRSYLANLLDIDAYNRLVIPAIRDLDDQSAAKVYFPMIRELVETSKSMIQSLAGLDKSVTENSKLSKELRAPSKSIHGSLQQIIDAQSIFEEWTRIMNTDQTQSI